MIQHKQKDWEEKTDQILESAWKEGRNQLFEHEVYEIINLLGIKTRITSYNVCYTKLLRFLFQLEGADVKSDVYDAVLILIENMENMNKHREMPLFHEAVRVIQSFRVPPAIEYFEKEQDVIPDVFVFEVDGNIEVNLNDKYYPQVNINIERARNNFV